MIFLLMFNENIHNFWSSGKEKWNEQSEKYHDLSLVQWFVLDCIEKTPLSKETEKKCSNQLQSTCSNVFWNEFISEIKANLPKVLSFEEETIKRMEEKFEWIMS